MRPISDERRPVYIAARAPESGGGGGCVSVSRCKAAKPGDGVGVIEWYGVLGTSVELSVMPYDT